MPNMSAKLVCHSLFFFWGGGGGAESGTANSMGQGNGSRTCV